jgi:integrase
MAAKAVNMATRRDVEAFAEPGKHACGAGLYLQVAPSGARSWLFRYSAAGRMREFGLGSYPLVTLAMARTAADKARLEKRNGQDPIEARRAAKVAERAAANAPNATFASVAEAYITQHAPSWRNPKSADQWRASLAAYAYPLIGNKSCGTICSADVLDVLRPIWTTKSVTASRVRQRVEAVLDAAKVRGLRTGDNPALWKGNLAHALPSIARVHKVANHEALPSEALPAVMAKLAAASGMAAKCLQFIALTAARASEATKATWAEIDFDASVWTVPAARMKGGKPHRVPLSDEALAILRSIQPTEPDAAAVVFGGQVEGKPISLTALMKALRRACRTMATVHGLRSTFRDWCAVRGVQRELAELALAHAVGTEVERAYQRSDLLEQRRELMQQWAKFTCSHCSPERQEGSS